MNMMPQPQGMAPAAPMLPPMPPPDVIEQAKLIMEAVAWEDIEPVIRTDERRNYNIDIETDSTVFEDAEAEKAARVECVTAIVSMLERMIPAIQANPKMAPMAKELGMFTLGAFKIGRTLEETFEETFDQLGNVEPQPNPEAEKIKADMAMKEKDLQARMAEKQADAQMKAQESQQKMAFEQEKFGLEKQKMELELAFKGKEMEFKERELSMKSEQSMFDREMAQANARFEQGLKFEDHQMRREDAQFNRQASVEDRDMKRQDMEHKHSVEGKTIQGEAEKVFSENGETLKTEVVQMIAQLSEQLAAQTQQLSEQNVMIAQALQGIAAQQDEMADGFTRVVSHMTAPRKVKRDEKGKAIGVEIGENGATDIKQMLESLTKGRQIVRGKDNRVEAFA